MMVGVYGYGYYLLARDPQRYAAFIWIGLAGKTLGPIGFLYNVATGGLPWTFAWVCLFNDVIWWPAFWSFALKHADPPGLKTRPTSPRLANGPSSASAARYSIAHVRSASLVCPARRPPLPHAPGPAIHHQALDQPHRGRAVAAAAMDECWFRTGRRDRLEELVRGFGVGLAVERNVEVTKTPAAFAAASSFSTSAPVSVARRRLMMETNPIFLISGTASADVAPAHATVVPNRARFLTPVTGSFVTSCAATADIKKRLTIICFMTAPIHR